MKRVTTILVLSRLKWLIAFVLIIVLCIIGRLTYLQLFEADDLTEKGESLWLRQIKYEPERGYILDRHGRAIVTNELAPNLVIVPAQVQDKEKTAHTLANVIAISYDQALKELDKKASTVTIHPEGKRLSPEQAKRIREAKLPGIYIAKNTKRSYPYGQLLSHVIGFTGIDNQGLAGLELQYDRLLKGEAGALQYISDAKGNELLKDGSRLKPPEKGYELETTIDLNVQQILERELDIALETYDPASAFALAVNPNNGQVLAIASRPSYDPAQYDQYEAEIYNRNLPIWSTFEPGSTFKIITLAAALEEETIDLEKDKYYDKGYKRVEGARLRCWKKGGHGSQSMLEVVQNSCNPGFVTIGQSLGKETLFSYIKSFGFGEKTEIDLQGEGRGILFSEDQVGPVELATTAFGQGVSVTPIQQVMAVSAAINGGNLYTPYITKAFIDPVSKERVYENKKELKRQVISEATSKQVRQALETVVAKGTGRPAYVEGYRVGGKTGTAQKVGEDGRYLEDEHIVSFIGFAPADDPELVVYLAIDDPKDTVQFGGVVAAPIVQTILHDSLDVLEVERRSDGLEKDVEWPEREQITVPQLIGQEVAQLKKALYPFPIEQIGQGDIVIDQSPKAGTKINEGEKVIVYTYKNNRTLN
ncbi:MAG TPA: stage V sporulation protein D [Pseudogracilibacillus sp.]|nr:stage V sporulation protein D [Pseudogracilibacillus sp.]